MSLLGKIFSVLKPSTVAEQVPILEITKKEPSDPLEDKIRSLDLALGCSHMQGREDVSHLEALYAMAENGLQLIHSTPPTSLYVADVVKRTLKAYIEANGGIEQEIHGVDPGQIHIIYDKIVPLMNAILEQERRDRNAGAQRLAERGASKPDAPSR